MRLSVNLAIVTLYNGFCCRILVFLISAVLAIGCNVKTLITKFSVNSFVKTMVFGFLFSLCICAFTELTILPGFERRRMRSAVNRRISCIVKIKEKVTVARVLLKC